jgi:hypothetical protein
LDTPIVQLEMVYLRETVKAYLRVDQHPCRCSFINIIVTTGLLPRLLTLTESVIGLKPLGYIWATGQREFLSSFQPRIWDVSNLFGSLAALNALPHCGNMQPACRCLSGVGAEIWMVFSVFICLMLKSAKKLIISALQDRVGYLGFFSRRAAISRE